MEKDMQLENFFLEYKNKKAPTIKEKSTFIEVARFPHYENVISNILAFFFMSDEEHGMKALFVKSLLESANVDPTDIIRNSDFDQIYAEREFYTDKNNYLDLLLYNSQFMCGIENKINSGVNNDLEDYSESVKRKAREEEIEKTYMILLTLKDEEEIARKNEYCNVTYKNFFSQIEKNIGEFLLDSDNTWVIFLKDFMRTIMNLEEETFMLDLEFLKFIGEYSADVEILINDLEKVRKNIKAWTESIDTSITNSVKLEAYKDIISNCKPYSSPKIYFCSYVIDIKIESKEIKTLTIEIIIDLNGVHFCYWVRTPKKNKEILKKELDKLDIKYIEYAEMLSDDKRFFRVKHLDYKNDEALINNFEKIKEVIYCMLEKAMKIKRSLEEKRE